MKEFIEVPFSAKDSELGGWEYTIPEGYTASIENGKIIVKKEESEDEKIRKWIINEIKITHHNLDEANVDFVDKAIAWLEKQDTKVSVYRDTLFKIATILSQYEDKDDSPLEKIRSIMIDGTICSMDLESKNKKQDEQKPTDEEMKILLQTEYEKGRADAIEQKFAWSKEDELMLESVIDKISDLGTGEMIKDWLKSLKEKYTWKPSSEQIIELRRVISGCSYDIEPLVEIEEHLKKLKKE